MKVVIAGSRSLCDYPLVCKAISDSGFTPSVIIQGGADGIDSQAKKYAEKYNLPMVEFAANWILYRSKAGPIRNSQMAEFGERLILIWNGNSKGSASMKKLWLKRHPVETMYEVIVK